jgi:hypothetical protein
MTGRTLRAGTATRSNPARPLGFPFAVVAVAVVVR